jgi:2-methylcitrate dehydratase PrpD
MAASLARSGIDAGRSTLDGKTGMTRLMVGPDYEALQEEYARQGHPDLLRFEAERPGDPLLILSPGLRPKRFPNCGSAHRSMDALLEMRAHRAFEADDVREVRVRAPRNHLNNLMYMQPGNGRESKFSLEHALAVVLVDGECRLSHFTDEALKRPDICAASCKIVRVPLDNREGDFAHHVEVELVDGETLSASVADAVGSRAAPFALDDYRAKFDTCTSGFLASGRAAGLRDALERLPTLETLAPLMDPLCERAS